MRVVARRSAVELVFLALVVCSQAFGQAEPVYSKALSNSVTTGTTQPFRLASNNQFHQLTVIASNVTTSSCTVWSGIIHLEGSQDNVTYTAISPDIAVVAVNTLAFTSALGVFGYVRINYVSGNTSACAITAWYSGTANGSQASNTPVPAVDYVQIIGNGSLFNGQQAVTATATGLPNQLSKQACVKASAANTINVYLGNGNVTTGSTTGGIELAPDEAVCLPVNNVDLIWVVASTTGASVSWIATN